MTLVNENRIQNMLREMLLVVRLWSKITPSARPTFTKVKTRATCTIDAFLIHGVDFCFPLNNSSTRPSNDVEVEGFCSQKLR